MPAYKTIYSKWLATELRRRGFEIVDIHPNPKKRWLDCYEFEETPELIQSFVELTRMRHALRGR